jgi:hypothetical protein
LDRESASGSLREDCQEFRDQLKLPERVYFFSLSAPEEYAEGFVEQQGLVLGEQEAVGDWLRELTSPTEGRMTPLLVGCNWALGLPFSYCAGDKK